MVLARQDEYPYGQVSWKCLCDCGKMHITSTGNLRSSRVRSCGCLAKDNTAKFNKGRTTHGMTHSREFIIWSSIRQRCYDSNHRSFPDYGGRGITICQRWDDFANFYEDMGPRPSPKHTIERINNNGPYAPENCRWAHCSEQSRNRRPHIKNREWDALKAKLARYEMLYGPLPDEVAV